MTITQLEYAIAVATHQNFTVAAKNCFVTQPSLSMQIQKLEDELEIQIFDRTKKPIQTTPVGFKIIEQAKVVVSEASRIKDIVAVEKGFIGGDFRLGIIPTVMPTLLPMFLKPFLDAYPEVNLIIKELPTNALVQMLERQELDAAIAATPLSHQSLKEWPLYYEPFVGYLPENHRLKQSNKLKVEDLSNEDILLLQDGHCFRDGVMNLCGNKTASVWGKNFEFQSGSFETIINLVDQDLGMTLLPYLNTLDIPDKKRDKLKHFESPVPSREISLIHHKKELKMHIIDVMVTLIKRVIKTAIVFQEVKIISPKST